MTEQMRDGREPKIRTLHHEVDQGEQRAPGRETDGKYFGDMITGALDTFREVLAKENATYDDSQKAMSKVIEIVKRLNGRTFQGHDVIQEQREELFELCRSHDTLYGTALEHSDVYPREKLLPIESAIIGKLEEMKQSFDILHDEQKKEMDIAKQAASSAEENPINI